MRRLLSYMRRCALQSLLAPLFKMLEAILELLVPLVVAAMIDYSGTEPTGYLLRRGGLLLALAFIGLTSAVTAQYFAAKAAAKTGARLRSDLFAHITRLPHTALDEIGAATLMNELGIETDTTFRNSTAYIQGWLTKLKSDARFIVTAASKAEKAVKLILNIEQEKKDAVDAAEVEPAVEEMANEDHATTEVIAPVAVEEQSEQDLPEPAATPTAKHDPVAILEETLEQMELLRGTVKAAMAYFKRHHNLKGCPVLSDEMIEKLNAVAA